MYSSLIGHNLSVVAPFAMYSSISYTYNRQGTMFHIFALIKSSMVKYMDTY